MKFKEIVRYSVTSLVKFLILLMEVGIGEGDTESPLDKMSFLIPAVLEFIMGVDHPGYHPQHGGIKFQMVVFDICVSGVTEISTVRLMTMRMLLI